MTEKKVLRQTSDAAEIPVVVNTFKQVPNVTLVRIKDRSDLQKPEAAAADLLILEDLSDPFFVVRRDIPPAEFQKLLSDVLGLSLNAGKESTPRSGLKVDVEIINALLSNATSTLHSMAKQTTLQVKYMRPLKAGEELSFDTWASIQMKSETFDGEMGLGFQTDIIQRLHAEIAGAGAQVTKDKMAGAVGELANIIYGATKKELNSKGHTLEKAIPSLKTETTKIVFDPANPVIILKLICNAGEFCLLVRAHGAA